MKITLNRTPEQVKLVQDLASKNKLVAEAAREALAAFMGPVIQKVINNSSTAAMIYTDLEFDQNTEASIPLDTYYGVGAGQFSVWSQSMAGGLPSNFASGVGELKVQTYNLSSAVSMLKKYAEQSRLDVVSATLTRLGQEILLKQNLNGWLVALSALAGAVTLTKAHTFRAATAGVLDLDTLSKLKTRAKRINASFANGTPDPANANGLTDLFLSPEMTEQIRAIAYNPQNTRGIPDSNESTVLGAPESIRQEIFRNGGTTELYGITFHELNELGVGYSYNDIARAAFGSTSVTDSAGANGATFSGTEQILVGVDMSRQGLIRPVEVSGEGRGQLVVSPDDQFVTRAKKLGFVAEVNEGRVVVDSRSLQGLLI
jgi:hypothetical protein